MQIVTVLSLYVPAVLHSTDEIVQLNQFQFMFSQENSDLGMIIYLNVNLFSIE